ncbi:MAG: 3-deoxy-manno-octulosonate cytidylyltransferase [Candidatus Omnitrophica bacterium]|nr:3-deoxy-manno-octulosonate cytidylyltransferase [Candidatus Omnitrophota bacterium]
MTAVGIIPARWASTRLPGKVLVDICGKPMIEHVWLRAKKSLKLSDVIIACDEPQVFERVKAFGASAVLTSKDHPSGSDRVAEAARKTDADVIVNIQGDEPLIDPRVIDALVDVLAQDKSVPMATVVKRVKSSEEFDNPNIVKVALDNKGFALYFSRAGIPFKRDGERKDYSVYFRHLGIYAYRRDFLLEYCQWPKSFLEQEEALEQLRVLEAGHRIRTVETDVETIGVDAPEDVLKVVQYLKAKPNA